ncbi:hypothetical protein NIES4071_72990 [Calothrix sp. NIES-4071]|nr:hypothetical protein NIES4071_72990 [Calothrix sp. NIES-4071]BAZ61574.1 hypothetical protein NIES4105_72940 [Calothrix sp. NIES-4105]
MSNTQISNMTLEALKEFVIEVVNDQLNHRTQPQKDERSCEEVLAAMDKIRSFTTSRFTHDIRIATRGT